MNEIILKVSEFLENDITPFLFGTFLVGEFLLQIINIYIHIHIIKNLG